MINPTAAKATSNVKIGDVVVYVKDFSATPVTTFVTKVTKTGRIEVEQRAGVQFKPDSVRINWDDPASVPCFTPVSSKFPARRNEMVFPLANGQPADPTDLISDPVLDKLFAKARVKEAEEAAKREEQNRQHAARDARVTAELAAVKAACNNDLPTLSRMTLPDGSRLVTMTVPVKPEYAERKGSFEVIICRLKNERDYDYAAEEVKTVVGLYMTYATGDNSSFPSCSGSWFDTDDEALWAAVSDRYHSW